MLVRPLILALLLASPTFAIDTNKLCPEATPEPGTPAGKVTEHTFAESKIFPGTTRKYWVYVPAQYDAKTPAAVMVFQDGQWYQDPKGGWRVPAVFDALIHKKEMPVTVGVFIQPGEFPNQVDKGGKPRQNRSFEYDTLSDQYARFLEVEMLPEVAKSWAIRGDSSGRAICGISSGGICAFTVAWEKPKLFSKVLSHVGSFTNIRGGNAYPDLVRKADPKPIKVFLHDGTNDLINRAGDWWQANEAMYAALTEKNYDVDFLKDRGFHAYWSCGIRLPEALRRTWKDRPAAAEAPR